MYTYGYIDKRELAMGSFCHQCGNTLAPGAKFCSRCGVRMQQERTPIDEAVNQNSDQGERRAADGHGREAAPVYAGFWQRLVAMLADQLLIFFAVFLGAFTFGFLVGFFGSALGMGEAWVDGLIEGAGAWLNLAAVLVVWLYYAGMESSSYQATLGKKLLELRVTDTAGNQVTFLRATGRHFAKAISVATLFAGYLMVAFTRRKQGLHDMIAGTLVTKRQ